jgi:CheY-like chemotaxis protein
LERIVGKILLVEDNELNRDMLSRRLKNRGHEVICAANGQQALARARMEHPELILMDVNLPDISGWDVTKTLKADPDTRSIPIIALTAHALDSHREQATAAGCDDYDTKPVEIDRLMEKINKLLNKSAPPG